MNTKIVNKFITSVILLCFFIVFISSCCDKTNNQSRNSKINQTNSEIVVYKGHRWDIIKINDSIFIASPGLNSSKNNTPVMFNIKRNPNALNNFN